MVMRRNIFLLHSLWLLVCITGQVSSTDKPSKLIALFHPGPGKTGTTHFQAFLMEAESELLKNNFAVWPDLTSPFQECKKSGALSPSDSLHKFRRKHMSVYYSVYERCLAVQQCIHKFIRESASLNRNVIFSSETFLANPSAVRNLLDVLTAVGYQIHGVIIYRFSLSWFISRYAEHLKTSSISSRETDPQKQLSTAFFSDYLEEYGRQYFQPQSINIFYDILSGYQNFRLHIIDFYGVVAANKSFDQVILCEIGGVLCNSSLIKELQGVQSHTSYSESTIHEMQMGFEFVKFSSRNNCSMDFSQKNGEARKFLIKTHNNHKWKLTGLLQNVNTSTYAQISLDVDRIIRNKFGPHILYGNARANEAKVSSLVKQIDRGHIETGKSLEKMLHFLKVVKRKGLCTSASS